MTTYYALNKDKVKARNDMNKEQRRAYNREYYLKNKAKIDEASKVNKLKRIEQGVVTTVKPERKAVKKVYNRQYYADNREILTIKRTVKVVLNNIIRQIELGVDEEGELFYDCD